LIVDDAPDVREFLLHTLTSRYEVVETSVPATALQLLREGGADALIVDLTAQDIDGESLVRSVVAASLCETILAIKERGARQSARLLQLGVYDFIEKPFTMERVIHTIERALEYRDLKEKNRALVAEVRAKDQVQALVGETPAATALREKVRVLASNDLPFAIAGEHGSGRGLFAAEVHRLSDRGAGPLIRVSCGSIPPRLFERELFGEEKEHSVAARRAYTGKVELADGGTLVLEDIDKVPLEFASRLARLIDDGSVERMGATARFRVNVRVVATTTRDLAREVRLERFDARLSARLSTIVVNVPPLRERREDIPLLARHFLVRAGAADVALKPDVARLLMATYWPGNVRELSNVIERALVFSAGRNLDAEHLDLDDASEALASLEQTFRHGSIREMEKLMIIDRLDSTAQNRTHAARTLDISVRTLRNKLREYREAGNLLETP